MSNQVAKVAEKTILSKTFTIYGTVEQPLFKAKDVADWLEINNVSQMLQPIDEDEKLIYTLHISGQNRDLWFLTEHGLYEVLFLSRKPIAKTFKKEVKKILHDLRTKGIVMKQPKYEVLLQQLGMPTDLIPMMAQGLYERDNAIKTKAEIGSRREATAMNTASQKSKENTKLKEELGKCKEYATILAVTRFYKDNNFKWQDLKGYCISHELDIKEASDERYGSVKSYPAKAWLDVYGVDLNKLF